MAKKKTPCNMYKYIGNTKLIYNVLININMHVQFDVRDAK